MKDLNFDDVLDILYGCTVLGTGGGGSLEGGVRKIKANFDRNLKLSLVGLKEVPDDEIVACPYHVGSISPPDSIPKRNDPVIIDNEALHSFKSLEDYMKTKFYGSIATELGGGNTAAAMDIAMNMGIPLVDADPVGRSVPGVQHSSYFLNGINIAPAVVSNKFGDVMIVKSIVDDFRAEDVIRGFAAQSENSVGVVSQPVKGSVLRNTVIDGTISFSQKIGHALRNAEKEGKDPVHQMLEAGNGYLLFEGEVISDADWKDENAYTVGEFEINGSGDFEGHNYKIWFQNENLVSWLDGNPDVGAPDLICVVKREDGIPITNPYQKKGDKVAVIGYRGWDEWRTEKALEIFAPKAFGYDIPWVPIEKNHTAFKGVA